MLATLFIADDKSELLLEVASLLARTSEELGQEWWVATGSRPSAPLKLGQRCATYSD
jgi:hypothetical protein